MQNTRDFSFLFNLFFKKNICSFGKSVRLSMSFRVHRPSEKMSKSKRNWKVAPPNSHFAWQPWHNLTSTFVSRGRRGTISHLPSFCVAGVALMVLGGALGPGFGAGAPRHFAWQAWHNLTSTFVSRGRRGTISHLPSFCVAGVALMVLGGALGLGFGVGAPRHFAWQAWHNLTSTFVSPGRCGTISHLPSFCVASFHVAGVAQSHIYRRFVWQAWHLWYWVAPLGRDLAPGRRTTLRGSRGTT